MYNNEKEIRDIINKGGKLDWKYISRYQKLSEEFIREFQDKVDWRCISGYQKLSEEFIREFQDKVQWEYISICQKLSEEFIGEFKDKITFDRPNIIFNRDIKHLDPCKDGIERYLSHTREDEKISWNTLLERHKNRFDIWWLCNKLKGRDE